MNRSAARLLAASIAGSALLLLLGAGASAGSDAGPRQDDAAHAQDDAPPKSPEHARERSKHDDRPRRGFGGPDGGFFGGRGGDGERFRLGDVSDESILAVIKDLDPDKYEAAKEKLTAGDAAARAEVRQMMMQRQRRLLSLAILRERNPELYETKKEEFQKQRETRLAAESFHDAKEKGDIAGMEQARTRLREIVTSAVDLGLKAKSQELKALLSAADRMRAELQNETRPNAIHDKVDSIVEEMLAHRPPEPGSARPRPDGAKGEGPRDRENGERDGERGPGERGANENRTGEKGPGERVGGPGRGAPGERPPPRPRG
jgi:hypothetical protein